MVALHAILKVVCLVLASSAVVPLDTGNSESACGREGMGECTAVAKPACLLYTTGPTARFDNELRELTGTGLNSDSSLDQVQLAAIDSMHYRGHESVPAMLQSFHGDKKRGDSDVDENGQNGAQVVNPRHILDLGSGFGGCSRHIAALTGTSTVTALELQPDISAAAKQLTDRCGLADRVAHVTGDILAPSAGGGWQTALPQDGNYELAFSKLVVLHIPFHERPRLWQRLATEVLAPGGILYLEDYFARDPTGGAAFSVDEITDLENLVGCPNARELPTRDAYVAQLQAAGFVETTFIDATTSWAPWVAERATKYASAVERNLRVQGPVITAAMGTFYNTTARLFANGRLGGAVISARRPSAVHRSN